ncbi:unnamed protein product [Nyctereutes procyonoides]|uniref:Cytochrome c oxidase subunit NDUFA4 n=1 Tax=Nyctereutes procyonoides TaxID=34880 RepID=A0A811Y5T2_NYCPR|nr:unnamed protein product [Nyctereutes procyonoides]
MFHPSAAGTQPSASEANMLDLFFVFIGAGGTRAVLYVLRLNNQEPWNNLGSNDQYKFYSVNVDYSKLKKEGPDF